MTLLKLALLFFKLRKGFFAADLQMKWDVKMTVRHDHCNMYN